MNTNINFQLFRVVAMGSIMFFAFAGSVFAAPILTPPTATQIKSDSARLVGFVSNHYQNTTVWIEFWGVGSSQTPTAYATQGIWHEGRFEWTVRNLTPGQTYYFRTAAIQGSATVYSTVSTLATVVSKPPTPITIIYEKKPAATVVAKTTQKETQATVVEEKAEIKTNQPVSSGFTREGFNNEASVIGAGNNALPTTLVGWMALLVALLVVVLIGRMIYDSAEDRQKRAESERRNKDFLQMQADEKKELE